MFGDLNLKNLSILASKSFLLLFNTILFFNSSLLDLVDNISPIDISGLSHFIYYLTYIDKW